MQAVKVLHVVPMLCSVYSAGMSRSRQDYKRIRITNGRTTWAATSGVDHTAIYQQRLLNAARLAACHTTSCTHSTTYTTTRCRALLLPGWFQYTVRRAKEAYSRK